MVRSQARSSAARSIAARRGVGQLALLGEKCCAVSHHICKLTSLRTSALRAVLAALSSLFSSMLWSQGVLRVCHGGHAVRVVPPPSNHPAI
eukprot:scaffold3542_cov113-Isochrysis_galbana.AAC.5